MEGETKTAQLHSNPEPVVKPEQPETSQQQTEEGGVFKCCMCSLTERYHAHGTRIPFARGIVFNEDAYVMRDPFTPYAQNAFLCLGGTCSLCSQLVCITCSIFYSKRFCATCAEQNIQHFPNEVQKKIRELCTKITHK